jgi:hypothetical protein
VELHEDDGIFEDRSERSNEPGQVLEEVLFLNRVEQDLEASVRAPQEILAGEHTPAP